MIKSEDRKTHPRTGRIASESPADRLRPGASAMIDVSQSTTLDTPAPDGDDNRRLRAQYAEIAQLAGGLAHEIRNPLSTMGLNLDLLAEEFRDPESPRDRRIVQKIDRIRREAHRLQGILEDFLRFARVQELEREPADLNAVVD